LLSIAIFKGEEMKKDKCIAIVLAAGKGKRMESDVPKQYIELKGKPIIYYSLNQFQQSNIVDEIILVTGKDEIQYCKDEIVDKYAFYKVKNIIEGGKERYHSVSNAVGTIKECDYIFIHDGARPFIEEAIISKLYYAVKEHKACVVGVKTKDTVKIADEEEFICATPNRSLIWNVQTPQVFEGKLIKKAYEKLLKTDCENITDDAMVVESMLQYKVKLVEGDYENIKITTPFDLIIGNAFLDLKNSKKK
jgi:2-C-methyl-D-erythritol 4-phosphate cytidylyltransferase